MKQQGCSNRTSLRETSRSVGIQFVEPQSMRRQSATSPHTAFRTSVSAIMTQVCITSKTSLKNVFLTVCVSVCVRAYTHMWGQAPTESRQSSWIPWNWSHKRLWSTLHRCWEPNLSSHQGSTFSQQLSPASSPSQELSPDCYSSRASVPCELWQASCRSHQKGHTLHLFTQRAGSSQPGSEFFLESHRIWD